MKHQIPAILESGGGAIVNVSSVFADRGGPTTDYSTSKHTVRCLTRGAAIEYAQHGIRINELQPGVIDTDMSRADPDGTEAVVASGIPLGRIGTGREIATAIAFLLSDDAAYITGAPCRRWRVPRVAVSSVGPTIASERAARLGATSSCRL